MILFATLRMALRALRRNKMRTLLTMLGIIIGVGAVITMVAIGQGAQEQIARQINDLGSNLIIVLSGTVSSGGVRMGSGTQQTITEEDGYALQREIPSIEASAPQLRGSGQIVFGNSNWASSIIGVTPEYLVARGWPVSAGRPLEQSDVDAAAKVVLLGQTVARSLFGDSDPVGETVRVRRVPHEVIGVLERKGQSMIGQDQDDVVLIPISTARKRVLGGQQVKSRNVNSITVAVVQFDPRLGAKDENLHRMEALTSGTRADIIVFPELSTTGYFFTSRDEVAAVAEEAEKKAVDKPETPPPATRAKRFPPRRPCRSEPVLAAPARRPDIAARPNPVRPVAGGAKSRPLPASR